MPLYGVGVSTSLNSFAKGFGGTASEFSQSDYIDKWIQAGKMSDQLKGGVCQGLSAMWMASRRTGHIQKYHPDSRGRSPCAWVYESPALRYPSRRLNSRQAVTDYLIEQVRIFGIGIPKKATKAAQWTPPRSRISQGRRPGSLT